MYDNETSTSYGKNITFKTNLIPFDNGKGNLGAPDKQWKDINAYKFKTSFNINSTATSMICGVDSNRFGLYSDYLKNETLGRSGWMISSDSNKDVFINGSQICLKNDFLMTQIKSKEIMFCLNNTNIDYQDHYSDLSEISKKFHLFSNATEDGYTSEIPNSIIGELEVTNGSRILFFSSPTGKSGIYTADLSNTSSDQRNKILISSQNGNTELYGWGSNGISLKNKASCTGTFDVYNNFRVYDSGNNICGYMLPDYDDGCSVGVGGSNSSKRGKLKIYSNSMSSASARYCATILFSGTSTATITLPSSTGTLATTSSDARLKINIKNTEIKALDTIEKIKVREFDWKENQEKQKIGFVADELKEIDEKFIIKGTGTDEIDSNGKLINPYCVDNFYMMGYVIKAIQELKIENENLKQQIALLKK